MSRASAGFTLLEMLVSVMISALVLTAAYQVFDVVRASYATTQGAFGRDLTAEVVLDRLEGELTDTLLLVKPLDAERLEFPWVFVSEDRVFGADDSDGLRFITRSPARLPGAPPTGPRMVSYLVDSGPAGRLDLIRQEQVVPGLLEKEIRIDDGHVAVEDVARFSLRFQAEGGDWRDAWDSTDIAMLDTLPAAVELVVQLYQRNDAGELDLGPEHLRVVELPVRPVDLTGAGEEGQVCADGPTVEECLAELEFEIEDLPRNEQNLIRTASAGAGPCWHEPEPNPRHKILFDHIEDLLGMNPREACR